MNTAARVLSGSFFIFRMYRGVFSLRSCGFSLLIFAVLTSSLSLVYLKTLQRDLYSQLQSSQQTYERLQRQWSQLLLEQHTLIASERIQTLAQQKLNMIFPQEKTIILVPHDRSKQK